MSSRGQMHHSSAQGLSIQTSLFPSFVRICIKCPQTVHQYSWAHTGCGDGM